MTEEQVQAIIQDVRLEQVDRFLKAVDAYDNGEKHLLYQYAWLDIFTAIVVLRGFPERLSDDEKRNVVLHHYFENGDTVPLIQRNVRELKKIRPENWRDELPECVKDLNTFTVYRGTEYPIEKVANSLSWTLSYDVAAWFAERGMFYTGKEQHIYKATISADDVIAYVDACNEYEILQDNSVMNIEELPLESPSEEFMEIKSIVTNQLDTKQQDEEERRLNEYFERWYRSRQQK